MQAAGRKFYTILVRDVTERERAEKRLRDHAALLDRATDAILVRDLAGVVRFWNVSAERLYGSAPPRPLAAMPPRCWRAEPRRCWNRH